MRDDSVMESAQIADESQAKPAWRAGVATAVGAILSLAILGVVVVWSYRLGVRDATDVPVIRAQLTETKVRPDAPGGLEVAHQDREVYGVVNAGVAETAATGYAPAEETLADEDAARIAVAPAPELRPGSGAETAGQAADAPATATGDITVAALPEPSSDQAAQAPAELQESGAAAAGSVPSAPEPVLDNAASGEAVVATPEVLSEPEEVASALDWIKGPGPRKAPPPTIRPVRTASAKPAEAPEPRAAALASRIQIQLGAFRSEAIANEQWDALKTRNGDLLAGRGRVITPVVSGGRKLYRLRAGPFGKIEEASALCRAMDARGEACIVARAK